MADLIVKTLRDMRATLGANMIVAVIGIVLIAMFLVTARGIILQHHRIQLSTYPSVSMNTVGLYLNRQWIL